MARRAEGWKLRRRKPTHNWEVRFTWQGVEYDRSTGTKDSRRAEQRAAQIYAEIISTAPTRQHHPAHEKQLKQEIGRWLVGLRSELDPDTVDVYQLYAKRWVAWFEAIAGINESTCREFMQERLRHVTASTVRKELSALRGFCRWLGLPDLVPSVPKRTLGTQYEKRRRSSAIQLSPEEARAIIRRLPEWSHAKGGERYPVKARFEFAYATGLRPSTISALSVPEHWSPRQTYLRVTAETDKNRMVRDVPLSRQAVAALKRAYREPGLIFGQHDYRLHIRRAAEKVLDAERLKRFCGAHLRSARATHWLADGEDPTGVQALLGHRRFETTAGYVRASQRAAETVVGRRRRRA